ncbi:MAG: glutamyl-tRNA reductase [Chloroflexi bacterium]|nr:glutamyl-tRNA reductase [Chloroflexota bacterium]
MKRLDVVVFAGFVALAGLFLPVVLRGETERRNRARCANNLRQLGLAAIQYSDDKRFFPHVRKIRELDGGYDSNHTPKTMRSLQWYGYHDNPEGWICSSSYDVFVPISSAAVRLARQILGGLEGRRVLLVGAGEAGQLVARALRTVGVADLVIANRTRPRAEELADYLSGRAISFSELGPALNDADIVISATDAPDYVITHDMVSQACIKRDGGGLFLFDLAMPRDIDPRVGEIGAVSLYNMDDLSAIAEENLEERKKAAQDAEAVVDGEVRRFMAWWASLDVMPVIRSLRRQAEDIRERELEKALSLMNALSPEDSKVVEALTRAIVNKLLHAPTESLRQGADKAQLAAAMDLFRLWDGDGPSPFGKDVAWNNEGSETRETGR